MKYLTFLLFLISFSAKAQESTKLLFREDFVESPPQIPIDQNHIVHSELTLMTYGPGRDSLKKSNHDYIPNDPYYVWSGLCLDNWAISFKYSRSINLKGGKIIWRSKQSGYRQLRLLLKLDNGDWIISDEYDGPGLDWHHFTFWIDQLHWKKFDIDKIVEGKPVDAIDLTKVSEIGFTDLMRGGGSPASSRIDWIEVYGQ